jgi:hypothetical protein
MVQPREQQIKTITNLDDDYSGTINSNNARIVNVSNPINPQDATTRSWVLLQTTLASVLSNDNNTGSSDLNFTNNSSITIQNGNDFDITSGISTSGTDITLQAGEATSGTGGNIVIDTGVGSVEPGKFVVKTGGSTVVEIDEDIMFLAESIAPPTTNPTGGVYLYVEGGSLKARTSSGNIVTLAAN